MPRISSSLAINARVSVTPHFLCRSDTLEALEGFVDPSAPGAGSLKYEGPRRTPARTLQGDVTNGSVNSRDLEDPDLLDVRR
ncbi:hypothetical protein VTP01DRAFT_1616 [Rhizomucor pusillus]|uniref:uncharacterized protein n=1 Tax=Rhizomucor pusillus TaxID=4840 RepID=UPI003743F615